MANEYIIDHRYAQSQIRYSILHHMLYGPGILDNLAQATGISVQLLTSACFGKSGLHYSEMAALIKEMMGVDLLIAFPWEVCGKSLGDELPCAEDAVCQDMLGMCQEDGKIPLSIWPEKDGSK
jgi:hypothetical protein